MLFLVIYGVVKANFACSSWWEPVLCIFCIIMRSFTCYILGLFEGSELGFYAWFWGARGSFLVIYQLGRWMMSVFRDFFIVSIILDWFFLGMILESELGLRVLYIVHSPHYEGSSFGFRFLRIADFELIVRANL